MLRKLKNLFLLLIGVHIIIANPRRGVKCKRFHSEEINAAQKYDFVAW